MTMKNLTAAATVLAIAMSFGSSAFACGNGECEPPPPPEEAAAFPFFSAFGFSASVTLVGKYPISFRRVMASFWFATSSVPLVSLPR